MLKPIHLCILASVAATCCLVAEADAGSGYWNVSGTIENVDADAFQTNRCEMANLTLRFRSRWANGAGCIVGFVGECPWGVPWGQTTTNLQGEFSKQSLWFSDMDRKRDILIEYWHQDGWSTLTIIEDISAETPHEAQGSTWSFRLETIQTTAFDCPTVLGTPASPRMSFDQRILGQASDTTDETNAVVSDPTVQPLPCGFGLDGRPTIDLVIINASVRHRDTESDFANPERISWEVEIMNQGTGTYSGRGDCRARVSLGFLLPENDNDYREYHLTVNKELRPGESRTFTSNSGNFGETSQASSPQYTVTFTVDSDEKIVELDETNNQLQGCYAPATQIYSSSPCQ